MVVSNYPPCRALIIQVELHKNTIPGNRHKRKIFLRCYTSPKIHQRYKTLICRMSKAEAARLENTQYLENGGILLTCLTHAELYSEGTYSFGFKIQGYSLSYVTEVRNNMGHLRPLCWAYHLKCLSSTSQSNRKGSFYRVLKGLRGFQLDRSTGVHQSLEISCSALTRQLCTSPTPQLENPWYNPNSQDPSSQPTSSPQLPVPVQLGLSLTLNFSRCSVSSASWQVFWLTVTNI